MVKTSAPVEFHILVDFSPANLGRLQQGLNAQGLSVNLMLRLPEEVTGSRNDSGSEEGFVALKIRLEPQ